MALGVPILKHFRVKLLPAVLITKIMLTVVRALRLIKLLPNVLITKIMLTVVAVLSWFKDIYFY